MSWIVQNLWLIPVLPLLAAGMGAVTPRRGRGFAAGVAIGSMVLGLLLSLCALANTLHAGHGETARHVVNFDWLSLGAGTLKLGWVLDPLTAAMLVMVTFVGTLIFIYSIGYMAHDANFTRFFCFLSLFAAAMLGLVIANNLLMFFMCWELVGLASYLLIGFWYQKPSAAAAAKKAFITTRIGDVFFFLGIIWLYRETGTLLFYNQGHGCLEQSALTALVAKSIGGGMAVTTAISLLIFCGAMGKSGQVPLHVWLPDAMEGPTPVSALIHAATMVAAGVFLMARVYPLLSQGEYGPTNDTAALQAVAWVGSITAIYAAMVAVAQNDIKRILAYSTVSQLGYMFMGLAVGGVAVGMFHLLTHAFFKALLFLGAGSVIHGCHEEQDIRRMGGLKKYMPVTFATYGIGMMALAGVPLLAGFWSKDEILHSAWSWAPSQWPFLLGIAGAFLTAFYMTRQMCYVFFGENRSALVSHHKSVDNSAQPHPVKVETGSNGSSREESLLGRDAIAVKASSSDHPPGKTVYLKLPQQPHESPSVMTMPLVILSVCAVLLGFLGTPVWPWLQGYLGAEHHAADLMDVLTLMILSTLIVGGGIWFGWRIYGERPAPAPEEPDALERLQPDIFALLRDKFYFDELYAATVVKMNQAFARMCDRLDAAVLDGLILAVSLAVVAVSWVTRLFDELVINLGFTNICERLRQGGVRLAALQGAQVQRNLGAIGMALVIFILLMTWGWSR